MSRLERKQKLKKNEIVTYLMLLFKLDLAIIKYALH